MGRDLRSHPTGSVSLTLAGVRRNDAEWTRTPAPRRELRVSTTCWPADFAEVRPDIAFVDIGLPGYDGYEVARRVRADLGPAVVLVALTGYGQSDDRQRALESGFDSHMTKPVSGRELVAAVGRAGQ